MRSRTRTVAVLFAAAVAVALVAAGCGGGGGSGGSTKTTTSAESNFKAALVSDVAGFNDNGFNKNQLQGLNKTASTDRDHGAPDRLALVERLRAELQQGDPRGREHRSSPPASCSATR